MNYCLVFGGLSLNSKKFCFITEKFFLIFKVIISIKMKIRVTKIDRIAYARAGISVVPVVINALIAVMIESTKLII